MIYKQLEAPETFDFDVFEEGVYSESGGQDFCQGGRICQNGDDQFVDFDGFELLAEKGAFLSSNLAALSPELLDHPIYGDPSTPTGQKTLQFIEQSGNFMFSLNQWG